MAGTKQGSRKAVAKILARDPDFFKKAGHLGGLAGRGSDYAGGFAAYIECKCNMIPGVHHKAQCAGKRGGRNSRRRKAHLSATVAQ